jgi:hypothetical protein
MKGIIRDWRVRLAGKKEQKADNDNHKENKSGYAFHDTFYHLTDIIKKARFCNPAPYPVSDLNFAQLMRHL